VEEMRQHLISHLQARRKLRQKGIVVNLDAEYFDPDNDGPIRVLSGFSDIKSELRTETDDLTNREIVMASTCFDGLRKTKDIQRQLSELAGLTGAPVIAGDEFIYMGTLRLATVIDLVLRAHPSVPGLMRKELLNDLVENGTGRILLMISNADETQSFICFRATGILS